MKRSDSTTLRKREVLTLKDSLSMSREETMWDLLELSVELVTNSNSETRLSI